MNVRHICRCYENMFGHQLLIPSMVANFDAAAADHTYKKYACKIMTVMMYARMMMFNA